LEELIIKHAKEQRKLTDKPPLKQYLSHRYSENEIKCDSLNLTNKNLRELNLSDLSFCKTRFNKAKLKDVILNNTLLDDADFTGAKKLCSIALSQAIWTNIITNDHDFLKKALVFKEKVTRIKNLEKTTMELEEKIKEVMLVNKALEITNSSLEKKVKENEKEIEKKTETETEIFFKLFSLMSETIASAKNHSNCAPAIADHIGNLTITNMVTNGGTQLAQPPKNQQQAEQISAIMTARAAPQVMAIIRHMALNLLQLTRAQMKRQSVRRLRKMVGWDNGILKTILTQDFS